jgi:hypothetical protein
MSIEDIRTLRNQQPFEPFDIILDDGSSVFVELPIRIALSPSGRMASVFVKDDLKFVEVSRVADLKTRRRIEDSATGS